MKKIIFVSNMEELRIVKSFLKFNPIDEIVISSVNPEVLEDLDREHLAFVDKSLKESFEAFAKEEFSSLILLSEDVNKKTMKFESSHPIMRVSYRELYEAIFDVKVNGIYYKYQY